MGSSPGTDLTGSNILCEVAVVLTRTRNGKLKCSRWMETKRILAAVGTLKCSTRRQSKHQHYASTNLSNTSIAPEPRARGHCNYLWMLSLGLTTFASKPEASSQATVRKAAPDDDIDC